MKRKVPSETVDRVTATGRERDVRNLVPFLAEGRCFFLTSPFIEPHFAHGSVPKVSRGSLPAQQETSFGTRGENLGEAGEEGRNYLLHFVFTIFFSL